MEDKLRDALARRKKRRIHNPERVCSAVLVPLFSQEGQCHVLFTRRTQEVTHHKGQISFPGGVYQAEDGTILNTALRECTEEIGLCREDAEILGELDDFITTTSNYIISPFVAHIPWPYHFRLSREETEELIPVPLAALQDNKNVHPGVETIEGRKITSFTYHYQGNVIWGATARILNQLLSIIQNTGG
jgi:8-oxo-dGTP pyrophosphatase MutT (NUDIX family)